MKKLSLAFAALVSILMVKPGICSSLQEPPRCPNVIGIHAVGVSQTVAELIDGFWIAGRRNQKYDTTTNWTFLMTNIPATSATEAYVKASSSLPSLRFDIGPLMGPIGKWICYYHTAEGYRAMTITPPIAQVQDASFANS